MHNLEVAEFKDLIDNPNVVILDVRRPEEFKAGYINRAININFEDSNFDKTISELDKSLTYAIYCRSGRRSANAIEVMKNLGFSSLFNLNGGIIEWESTRERLVKKEIG